MSLVRKVALAISVVLVVGLTVAFVARRGQLGHARDLELTAAAELGAERVSALVASIEVAADAGADPRATLESITRLSPDLGVCVVTTAAAACGGRGPQVATDRVGDRQILRRSGELRPGTTTAMRDGPLGIDVDGPILSVLAQLPAGNLLAGRTPAHDLAIEVWATDSLPSQAPLGEFLIGDGVRQYAVDLDGVPNLYVVAATSDRVDTPLFESVLFVVIGVLAALLLALAGFAAFLDQRRLVERASVDQLTRLPNRSEFERRTSELIAQSDRAGRGFALLLFDLNGFKAVNDTYGHQAGDELLQVIGERLARGTRRGDIVARWGGDEFMVVMPGVVDEEMGARRGLEIAGAIGGRIRIDAAHESVRVGASVGVAFWPRHGERLAQLVEAADAAMYQAKRQGLGCVVASSLRIPDTVPTELV